ncbi:MAG TPA: hypothetical protein VK212_05945 [Lentimicrobium sp.]|nr:hypothetical protein [Lentimicrobium sp.]
MKTCKYCNPLILFCTILLIFSIVYSCDKKETQQTQPNINVHLLNVSECKLLKAGVSDSLSCIEYNFEPTTGKLNLKHINSAFNCCPGEISGNISMLNDTIILEENESESGCNCDCLYDLDFEISGVAAKAYRIKIIEPYLGDQQSLDFFVNLENQPTGNWCVIRTNYPYNLP